MVATNAERVFLCVISFEYNRSTISLNDYSVDKGDKNGLEFIPEIQGDYYEQIGDKIDSPLRPIGTRLRRMRSPLEKSSKAAMLSGRLDVM